MGVQQSSVSYKVGVSDFNPLKYQGDWWVIGKTSPFPYDEGSDEYKQTMTWNPETMKMEVKNQGYLNGDLNEYTHSHWQFWRANETCPAMMHSHFNGYPVYMKSCLIWTNYDDFAIWSNLETGSICLLSRQRKFSGNNSCALSKILAQACVDPGTMRLNPASIDEHAPGTRLTDAVPLMVVPF